jgi:hypothetical protein
VINIEVRVSATIGRHADPMRNEDRFVLADPFYAVVDGATAKGDYTGESPGRRAAAAVEDAIRALDPMASAREGADRFSAAIKMTHRLTAEASASVLMISLARGEIWAIGDGWVSIDGVTRHFRHETEARGAYARAALLLALRQRTGGEQLLGKDPGREMILPLLRAEHLLSNVDRDDPLCFGRVDGQRVPDRFLNILPVPATWRSIVLASDGYPELLETFEASERALADRIARDPLFIEEPPMTKGVRPGHRSFDDRTWLELRR